MMENTITVAYEAVFHNRDNVDTIIPKVLEILHIMIEHLNHIFSRGSAGGLGTAIGTAISLAPYIAGGQNFNNPLEAILAGANLLGNIRSLQKKVLDKKDLVYLKMQ